MPTQTRRKQNGIIAIHHQHPRMHRLRRRRHYRFRRCHRPCPCHHRQCPPPMVCGWTGRCVQRKLHALATAVLDEDACVPSCVRLPCAVMSARSPAPLRPSGKRCPRKGMSWTSAQRRDDGLQFKTCTGLRARGSYGTIFFAWWRQMRRRSRGK